MKIDKALLKTDGGAFKDYLFMSGLRLKTPIDQDLLMRGITEIAKAYPQLSETSFSKKDNYIKLENDVSDVSKQMLIRIEDGLEITIAWGYLIEFNIENLISFYNLVEKVFNLHAISLHYLDFKHFCGAEWKGNHYLLFRETFIKSQNVSNLFEDHYYYGSDFKLRGRIDEDRIAVYFAESNVSDEEITKNEFNNEYIKATCGVAQVRNFSLNLSFGEIFENHFKISTQHIEKIANTNFFRPLNDALLERF